MSAQRVLILSSQTLFAESLVLVLEEHGHEVIGVQPYNDAALDRVAVEQPGVVILDALAAQPSATAALLECGANIRVLQVSLDTSTIATYNRQESGATVEDLLRLVDTSQQVTVAKTAEARAAAPAANSTNVTNN